MEQYFFEHEADYETDGDVLLKQKWSPISAPTSVTENDSSCFECNICLDSANEPVVTLCGHLYCWACIYKWFCVETSSVDADELEKKCPVCKADISVTSLVPLYGRGASSSVSESEKPNLGVVIPRRPRPSMLNSAVTSDTTSARQSTQRSHPDYFQSQTETFHYPSHTPIAFSSLGGMATISFFNPLIGLFGGMALGRIFGGSAMSLFTYRSTNPVFLSNNPRIRRQEMEVERCLNRVSFFLFCCLVLCLLLF